MIYSDGDYSVTLDGLRAVIKERSWYHPKFRLVEVPEFVRKVAGSGVYNYINVIDQEIRKGDKVFLGGEEFIYKTSTGDHITLIDPEKQGKEYISNDDGEVVFRKEIIQYYLRRKNPDKLRDFADNPGYESIVLIEIDDDVVREDLKTKDGLELFLTSLSITGEVFERKWAIFSGSLGPVERERGEVLSHNGLVHIMVKSNFSNQSLQIKYDRGGKIKETKMLSEKPGCKDNIFKSDADVYWRIPNAKNEIIWE